MLNFFFSFILRIFLLFRFISASYALKYGINRLEKLVLLSPIGIQGFPGPLVASTRFNFNRFILGSLWRLTPQRLLSYIPSTRGRQLISRARQRVLHSFPYDDDTVIEYAYSLATVGNLSGEIAFTKLLTLHHGWRLPIGEDLIKWSYQSGVPKIVFAYGERDWIDPTWAVTTIKDKSRFSRGQAEVYLLPQAGHHGYCENPRAFEELVIKGENPPMCRLVEPVRNLAELVSIREQYGLGTLNKYSFA